MMGIKTSLVCFWLINLQCLAIFCFKSYVYSSASLASFTRTVEKYSMAASIPSTLIGTHSRSRSVAAISLMEQEKLDEAKESLAQTALTLSLGYWRRSGFARVGEKQLTASKTERNFETPKCEVK